MSWVDQVFKWLGYAQYNASPTTRAEGEVGPLQSDTAGNLLVAGALTGPVPASRYRVATLTYQGVIVAAPRQLIAIHGYNASGANSTLMLFNLAAVPANGTTPFDRIFVPDGQSFSYEPAYPDEYSTGICWAASSSDDTLTIDNTATWHVVATYAAL